MDGTKWTMKKILNDYKCEGQMSIFEFIPYPEPKTQWELPCDTCGHDIKGCCDYDYINNHDYCVLGDKWIPKAPEEVAAAPTEDFMNPPEEAAKAADHKARKAYVDALLMKKHTEIEKIPFCEHSKHSCNKKELWKVADTLDETQCPHVCCRMCNTRNCGARCNGSEEPKPIEEKVYPLDIKGICDDPYCPQCGYAFETIKTCKNYEVDCERCPECHVKVDWTLWHRINDKEVT